MHSTASHTPSHSHIPNTRTMGQRRLLQTLPSAPPADEKTLLISRVTPRYVAPGEYTVQLNTYDNIQAQAIPQQRHQQHHECLASSAPACASAIPVVELQSHGTLLSETANPTYDRQYSDEGGETYTSSESVSVARRLAMALGIELSLPCIGSCKVNLKVSCTFK